MSGIVPMSARIVAASMLSGSRGNPSSSPSIGSVASASLLKGVTKYTLSERKPELEKASMSQSRPHRSRTVVKASCTVVTRKCRRSGGYDELVMSLVRSSSANVTRMKDSVLSP